MKTKISPKTKQRAVYWYEWLGLAAVIIAVILYGRESLNNYLAYEATEAIKIEILADRLKQAEQRAERAEEAIQETTRQLEVLDVEQIQLKDAVRGLSTEFSK